MINKGNKVAHRLNPLRWRGEITEVKLNGRVKVMLTTGIEVEVPSSILKLDVFTDEEVEVMLKANAPHAKKRLKTSEPTLSTQRD